MVSFGRFRIVQKIEVADDGRIDVIPQLPRLDGFHYVTENLAEIDQIDHIRRVSATANNDCHQVRHSFLQCANDFFQDGVVRRKIGNKDTGVLLFDCLRDLDERSGKDRIPVH